jgi:hypothetical protein
MRESKKTEKMHLRTDSYEGWLKGQKPGRVKAEPKQPPEGSYEGWLEKRVERRFRRRTGRSP